MQKKLDHLLRKIIRYSVGRTRYIMAATGLSIALLLILSAVQIQVNYNELLYGEGNRDSIANFLVVNKKVDGNRKENVISAEELQRLQQQPFIQEVGQLTSSRFRVTAQSPSERFPFFTEFFFESVPNDFIDVKSEDWKWQEGSNFIPLIIPNQFLDIYNFGFAPSQNLMQLTQDMVMALPIVIQVQHHGLVQTYTGRVVGFSDRISSVLVPQNFLEWANKTYGTQQAGQPSRVVIKTKDPGNPELVTYLEQNGLVTDADKTRFSKFRQVVNTIVSASWLTGAVMLVFALLVFSLFIQLTIASTKREINLLITIGTSPNQLYRFLVKQFLPANIFITIGCLLVVAGLQWWLQAFLEKQYMYIKPMISVYTLLAAALVFVVLWLVNRQTIKKYIKLADGE